MASSCTVLIAAAEILSELKRRIELDGDEILAFADTEALAALDAIMQRRPAAAVLESQFAATARGTALINRIIDDPSLVETEIRVISHESNDVDISARTDGGRSSLSEPEIVLDSSGTRRAPRYRVDEFVEVLVDGNLASVVDLSTEGAQVLSPTVLKPNQRVRIALADEQGSLRFNASVAWASFEIPQNGGPRYRAGIAFIDADAPAVDSYAQRHRA